jgi:uncharacterized protein
MSLKVNLRHLARHEIVLKGELPVAELELDIHDELVAAHEPLKYELEAQLFDDSLLARGKLNLALDCECVRCLKPFKLRVKLPDWICHLPIKGEESVPVVSDSVDLTPHIREDILLALPAHPVCKPQCAGLAGKASGSKRNKAPASAESNPAAWSELDKLKL